MARSTAVCSGRESVNSEPRVSEQLYKFGKRERTGNGEGTVNRVYLDYAATSPMRSEALQAMETAMKQIYGNASTVYEEGAAAKRTLEDARETLAQTIGAKRTEIFFTSGGTESDNWALVGTAEARKSRGRHLIVSAIEHHAVLRTAEYLERRQFELTRLDPGEDGIISADALEEAICPGTSLVSVMAVNNEIGTIEPIRELAQAAGRHGAWFHTDAVQAYGKMDLDVRTLPVDLMSVSAHKIGGPKGIGFLYIRSGVKIGSFLHGGRQEHGRRAGTENVPAAVGFAAAAKALFADREKECARQRRLQELFLKRLSDKTDGFVLNGPPVGERRICHNISISFPGLSSDSMVIALGLDGVDCSAGAACTTGAPEPSHVLQAVYGDKQRTRGTLRFSFGASTSSEEIEYATDRIAAVADRFRRLQSGGLD